MDATTRASALFIAAGVAVAGLYVFRGILAPLALAVFLWLIMDGFARTLQRGARSVASLDVPWALALLVAVAVVAVGATVVVAVVGVSAMDFARRGPELVRRIDEAASRLFESLPPGEGGPPSLSTYLAGVDVARFFLQLASAARGIASNGLYVALAVAFLFASQGKFPRKMRAIFPDEEGRARASHVIGRIREGMERYLTVQTLVSGLSALASNLTLKALGLESALFWGFLIFLLGYIPTIGSIVATILPALFALMQFDTLWQPAAVFLGVGFWQFTIGNFLQPRLQGRSLNLAIIVVLLGLVVWGALWGLVGMFLSSPLTAAVMLLLAQSRTTRWIAVLMSSNGDVDDAAGAGGGEA